MSCQADYCLSQIIVSISFKRFLIKKTNTCEKNTIEIDKLENIQNIIIFSLERKQNSYRDL